MPMTIPYQNSRKLFIDLLNISLSLTNPQQHFLGLLIHNNFFHAFHSQRASQFINEPGFVSLFGIILTLMSLCLFIFYFIEWR